MTQVTLILSDKQYKEHPEGAVICRQGDVLLFKPKGFVMTGKKIEDGEKNRVVLAHGEVTGHAHAFYFSDINDINFLPNNKPISREKIKAKKPKENLLAFELFECEKTSCSTLPQRLLRLHERALLRHEEHHPMNLPTGDYIVVIQHEGDELGELRKVAD